MTAQEKAEELVNKFRPYTKIVVAEAEYIEESKQCALITVDEMINYLISNEITGTLMSYWEEVKQEIEKL